MWVERGDQHEGLVQQGADTIMVDGDSVLNKIIEN